MPSQSSNMILDGIHRPTGVMRTSYPLRQHARAILQRRGIPLVPHCAPLQCIVNVVAKASDSRMQCEQICYDCCCVIDVCRNVFHLNLVEALVPCFNCAFEASVTDIMNDLNGLVSILLWCFGKIPRCQTNVVHVSSGHSITPIQHTFHGTMLVRLALLARYGRFTEWQML